MGHIAGEEHSIDESDAVQGSKTSSGHGKLSRKRTPSLKCQL